jgi:type VI secretion system secreted protein VgrG
MGSDDDFIRFMAQEKQLVTSNRPIRLRLAHAEGISDDMLLPQKVLVSEAICGGLELRVLCVSTSAFLPLKELIALPGALDFVTDRGRLHSVAGIVVEAGAGGSDGGIATYQLVLRDALTIMEKRVNTRIFRNMNEFEAAQIVIDEWRHDNAVLASCFEREVDECFHLRTTPRREFIMQHNETDAAFVRRLLGRAGIGWYFRAGRCQESNVNPYPDGVPAHTMVMFNNSDMLRPDRVGELCYHRDSATEERDTITSWSAVRTLQAGHVARHSWDYKNPLGVHFMAAQARGHADQGYSGNELAASLDDYQVQAPHTGADNEDLQRLGQLRMRRNDYESKCFHAEGGVRDLPLAGYFSLTGHPEIDRHAPAEREFVVTARRITAQNNLPGALAAKAERLFAHNRWMRGDANEAPFQDDIAGAVDAGAARFHIQFTAVRSGVPIVPAYDALTDLPRPQLQSAVVVGPQGEEVHCDQMGRVKIRFPGLRAQDHAHAHGVGTLNNEGDSAWVRVASNWAGDGPGSGRQCGALFLPRVGSEVLVDFLGGDPDKPIIVGQLYNQHALPAAPSSLGDLPVNRYLSGIKSREVRGGRANGLRFDDTPGQISAQLSSDHGASQLNLGWLTQPRGQGQGVPRGEGFELASDESGSLRTAKSLLISAWGRLGAGAKQLSDEEHVALLADCLELCKSLGQYAAEHLALAVDPAPQAQLKDDVGTAAAGGNTDPRGAGGKPTVSVTAPAGLALSTPQTIVSYAGVNVDTVAQRHMQLTSGQRFNLNAGKGISLFSHHDGIKAIAHYGKWLLQSQHDDIAINAAKNIDITATDGIIRLMAKEIHAIAEDGSFIKIGGGITLGSKGDIAHKAAHFPFTGPATMAADLPRHDSGNPDQKFILKYHANTDGALAAPDTHYEIAMSDGSKHTGISDAQGKTNILQSDAMHIADIRILKQPS